MTRSASPAESQRIVRIPTLRTPEQFRRHVAGLGIDLRCEDTIVAGPQSPLLQPGTVSGRRLGNRWAVQPMEGWDGTPEGGITESILRRWQRFGQSGAKLIWGGEAMAVRADGRANPNQLIICERTKGDLARLREALLAAHRERYGTADDLLIGFQLTHSGRFCRPCDKRRLEPKVAYRHPILDRRFGVSDDSQVISDSEVERLIECFIAAAKVAADAGADFVDIKHCHGYLLHEFLSAHTRPGKYGGPFENRTRILREIVQGIRASGNRILIGVRLSAFDFVPFRPDPARSRPGRPGPGIPEDYMHCLPYLYAFGVNPHHPVEPDLTETFRFIDLLHELEIKLLNLSAGSPYYNPHIQRPALFPPSDGYPAAGRPAGRRGAADQRRAGRPGAGAAGPADRGQRLQLPPGVSAPGGAVLPAPRARGCGGDRAVGAGLPDRPGRRRLPWYHQHPPALPNLQRLHHGPAQRAAFRLLPPG